MLQKQGHCIWCIAFQWIMLYCCQLLFNAYTNRWQLIVICYELSWPLCTYLCWILPWCVWYMWIFVIIQSHQSYVRKILYCPCMWLPERNAPLTMHRCMTHYLYMYTCMVCNLHHLIEGMQWYLLFHACSAVIIHHSWYNSLNQPEHWQRRFCHSEQPSAASYLHCLSWCWWIVGWVWWTFWQYWWHIWQISQ